MAIILADTCSADDEDECLRILCKPDVIREIDAADTMNLGITPISGAVSKGLVRLLHALIMMGADPGSRSEEHGHGIHEIALGIDMEHARENVLNYINNAKNNFLRIQSREKNMPLLTKRKSTLYHDIPPKEAFYLGPPSPPRPDCDCKQCVYSSRYHSFRSDGRTQYYSLVEECLKSHNIYPFQFTNSYSEDQDPLPSKLFKKKEEEENKKPKKEEQREEDKKKTSGAMMAKPSSIMPSQTMMVELSDGGLTKEFFKLRDNVHGLCTRKLGEFYGHHSASVICEGQKDRVIAALNLLVRNQNSAGAMSKENLRVLIQIIEDTENIYREYKRKKMMGRAVRISSLCRDLSEYWNTEGLDMVKKTTPTLEGPNQKMVMIKAWSGSEHHVKNSLAKKLFGGSFLLLGKYEQDSTEGSNILQMVLKQPPGEIQQLSAGTVEYPQKQGQEEEEYQDQFFGQ